MKRCCGSLSNRTTAWFLPILSLTLVVATGCPQPDDDDAGATSAPPGGNDFPQLTLETTTLTFGDVVLDSSADKTLEVSNTGTAVLLVEATITESAQGQFLLLGEPVTLSISPDDSALLTVRFTPNAVGPHAGTLHLSSNDEDYNEVDIGLEGTGTLPDADGDGYTPDVDCDDSDPAINPGALEVCDGVDNNCDELIDGDATDASTWYLDADMDGYGGDSTLAACDAPAGYVAEPGDCDDGDPAVFPGALEVCDGIDNDCDNGQPATGDQPAGGIDEDVADAPLWYVDSDADGYGTGDPVAACQAPEGYAAQSGDCDDTSNVTYPGALERCDLRDNDCDCLEGDEECVPEIDEDAVDAYTWYRDQDGDGYGASTSATETCDELDGFVADAGDCNDVNPAVFPGAPELCDGIDNDCDCDGLDETCVPDIDEDAVDKTTWYPDGDADGYGRSAEEGGESVVACEAPDGYVALDGDCDDSDPAYHPGALENDCTDPHDYNCDGSTGYSDEDGDTFPACQDCDDDDPAVNSNALEVCDGIDNNCDGQVDEGLTITLYPDDDQDTFGDGNAPYASCSAEADGYSSNPDDCDDTNPNVNPDAPELCDGLDNDCDEGLPEGGIDEGTGDSAPEGSTLWYSDIDQDGYGVDDDPVLACNPPEGYTAETGDCDDADPRFNPGALEVDCTDPNDYNCDGETLYADVDGDGSPACLDCDDTLDTVYPGADEVCDGLDNDCDAGQSGGHNGDTGIDEGVTTTFYADSDGDGFGNAAISLEACTAPDSYVEDNTDCDDTRATTNPGALEYCNGRDDDCDHETDEANAADCTTIYADADGDGWGTAVSKCQCTIPPGYSTKTGDCNDASPLISPDAVEKCDLIDNNCNGEIDEENAYQCDRFYNDQDADGWGYATDYKCLCGEESTYTATAGGDCDDTNADVYPGRPEQCDEADNNCNGQVDEGVKNTYYLDNDGDGYGASYNTRDACTPPTGYVSVGGDCNDYNANISPGIPEKCDDIDNNCNGQEDEGLTQVTVYIDLDGDGHGAEGTSGKKDCLRDEDGDGVGETPPDGYVLEADDCDDSSSTVHPGAPELCDGRLNDCNLAVQDVQCPVKCEGSWPVSVGGSAGYPIVAQLDSDNELEVIAQNEGAVRAYEYDGTLKWSTSISVSYSYPNVADMNYDNTLDVLVGAHGGTFYVLNGSTGAVLTSISTGTNYGYYGSSAFDVDGDQATDIVPTGGTPYKLILMNRDLTQKSLISLSPLSGEYFSLASSSIYDYDGYGIASIILGSGNWTCASTPENCMGRLYVFNTDGSYWNDPTWTDPSMPWFEVAGYPYTNAGEGDWPIIADADGDGVEETSLYFTDRSGVTPSKSWIWNPDGTEHPLSGVAWNTTFPVLAAINADGTLNADGQLRNAGGPVVDIDNDGIFEIVSSGSGGVVVTKAGQVMDGYPIKLAPGPRVIGDINRDGRLDILFHSSSNNSVNCYTMGEGTYDDNRILNYGTVDGLGRQWYTTGHLDPYEPNDRRAELFDPVTSTNPVGDSRAFYLGALRDTYASGNGWYRRIRGLISESGDRDYYYLRGGIINVSLDGLRLDLDLYVHQFHPDGTYINTFSSTQTGTKSESTYCHSTNNCAYTNENKTFIIEVRGKDPNVDYGPFPYRLSAVWAN